MEVSNFLNTEFVQYSIYNTARSICNYIDGCKISHRKVVNTFDVNNITSRLKVSQATSKVAEQTQYIHGEVSLAGVIAGLAQDYTGSNNLNLLDPDGNFGTRFIPEPSAARYIYTKKSKFFDKVFIKEDSPLLTQQYFEGEQIEPKFYLPILPLSLVNGSEGIGSGFAQKILPRDPNQIIKELISLLSVKDYKINPVLPYFKGFAGKIIKNVEDNSYTISGICNVINTTTVEITELPIGRTLQEYLKVLNDLVEKKVIKDYVDKSDNDVFYFKLDVTRDFTKQPIEKIYEILKLNRRVTENLTCLDENNLIVEFNSAEELLEKFVIFRLDYYQKRKQYLLKKLKDQLILARSKMFFITNVLSGKISINNASKDAIISQIQVIPGIIKIEDSYEYLLKMPIYSLTQEKIAELKDQIDEIDKKMTEVAKTSKETMWIHDLKDLEKIM